MKLVSGEIFRPSIGIIVDDHGIGDGGGGIEMMAEDEVPKAHLARHVADQRGQYLQIASVPGQLRSEEHTSELQSLMRISYAVFCLKKKNNTQQTNNTINQPNQHR